ncbi:hypothetical protein GEU84_013520 [Fertoebacter nigrum]|uniref:Translocase n=1 Tax=Fertoeibacter niger TaxID=2656921 RepID=A0A8X8KRM7_9RHOB|nr:hypothetical protein [Fertoeibacter niger]NUB45412.1 hypothetical protein [Fertoeibacter niger]
MDLKRKAAMVVLTLAVAFACGQFVQYGTGFGPRLASLPPEADPTPRAIVPLAADSVEVIATPVEAPSAPRLPDQAMLPAPADLPIAIPLPAEPAALPPLTAEAPAITSLDCPVQLDVTAQPDAMLGVTMLAPCHANQRVVLRHAGLAFTGKTSATGGLFLTIPGLQADAEVSVLFADGDTAEGRTRLPDMADTRRFAVQWMADDMFQLHAFENGADYGTPGHISAADPQRPAAGVPTRGGFLSPLGDASVDLPMLAEVYTFPKSADVPVSVAIEAAVTEATCNRDLLGETLVSVAGKVTVTDLTVAMPGCDALGDYLVLNNLLPEMNIATAN